MVDLYFILKPNFSLFFIHIISLIRTIFNFSNNLAVQLYSDNSYGIKILK